MLHTIVLVVHVVVALMIIGLVLLQRGKGAEAGTGFGAGASGTVFGARGSANFLSRTTGVLADVVLHYEPRAGVPVDAAHGADELARRARTERAQAPPPQRGAAGARCESAAAAERRASARRR